jgi:putative tryptophan/tyrosine transport system substrate-binding protein
MIALKPDVILAHTTAITATLQRESSALPIVFVNVSDPIGSGFIANLARPGGNITGVMHYEAGIVGKWLGLLKEIAPHIKRTGMMFNPETAPYAQYYVRPFEGAARSFGVEPILAPVHDDTDIAGIMDMLAHGSDAGLIVHHVESSQAHH